MWTRHTSPDGRPYYYNAALKKSSWTRPPDFPGGASSSDRQVWEQHVSPDGRPYFYNPVLKKSSWTRPEGVTIVTKGGSRSKESLETMNDQFFSMFESCPALQFSDRTEEGGQIDAVPSSTGPPTFEAAATSLSAHPTWSLASTDGERREMFQRWIEKKKEEARQAARRRLFEVLEESCPWITVETTWKEALGRLEERVEFQRLSKYDQVDVFDAFMAKVEARAVQSQSVSDEIRQRKERQSRIMLRKIFRDHFQRGIIHAKLTWKEYLASDGGREASCAIKAVEGNAGGSRPRDLFMDVIEQAEIAYENDEDRIETFIKNDSNDEEALRRAIGSSVAEASIRLFMLQRDDIEKDNRDQSAKKIRVHR